MKFKIKNVFSLLMVLILLSSSLTLASASASESDDAFNGVDFTTRYLSQNLVLPAASASGYTLTWESLNPAAMDDNGILIKSSKRQYVILRGIAVKSGEAPVVRDFPFIVLAFGEAEYNMEVNEDNLGIQISPTLHGLFFEDINHSLDGGLNAQLIDNGSFQQYLWPDTYPNSGSNPRKNGPPNGNYSQNASEIYSWRTVAKGSGAGTAMIIDSKPMNTNNNYSVEINVTTAGNGFGIGANGYSVEDYYDNPNPTIAVNAGWQYDVSLYLQGADYNGNITVFLENALGAVNSNIITIPGSGLTDAWKQFSDVLTATRNENNRLVVLGSAVGSFCMDFVQLTPAKEHLWRNGAAGGVRADMAQALADLQPKFLRFPGGCASEGASEARQYFWKNTVGAREERKGIPNYWGYWSSNEFGFFEYFCLAEQLGAEALPVINLGVTCQFQYQGTARPVFAFPITGETDGVSNLQRYHDIYVADALDLIEFCNGGVDTKWGALRAEMGHPEPFNLKYVAIGNENGGSTRVTSTGETIREAFWARFKILWDEIKAKYPEMEVITNSDYAASGSAFTYNYQQIDANYPDSIVDEHYYQGDNWFLANTHRYDPGVNRPGMSVTYDRSRPTRVFVGEYAGNNSVNTMYSAVAEAAFTIGLERNSDIVSMACYAPTFAQASAGAWGNWPNNLIWFDNTGIWRTPNYYYHKLFAANIGDRVVQYSDITLTDRSVYRQSQTSNEGIYKVVSKDTRTGELYIKLVNAEASSKPMAIRLNGQHGYYGTIEYIYSTDSNARNHLYQQTPDITNRTHDETITPILENIGYAGDTLQVELKPFSVNVIKLTPVKETDFTPLIDKIAEMKAIDDSIYTAESLTAFKAEIAAAEAWAVVNQANETISQAEVNDEITKLDLAITRLSRLRAYTTMLELWLDQARAIDAKPYTITSYVPLAEAIEFGNETLALVSATVGEGPQPQIDAAIFRLIDAIDGLIANLNYDVPVAIITTLKAAGIEGYDGDSSVGGVIDLWWDYRPSDAFMWNLIPDSDYEYFQFERVYSVNVLAPTEGNVTAGTILTMAAPSATTDNQWWKLERQSDGTFIISNKADPTLCVALVNNSTNDGTRIVLSPISAGTTSRFWKLDPLDVQRPIYSAGELEDITVKMGAPIASIGLPEAVPVLLEDHTVINLPVIWDTAAFDSNVSGVYALTGTLSIPAGIITNPSSVMAKVNVIVIPNISIDKRIAIYGVTDNSTIDFKPKFTLVADTAMAVNAIVAAYSADNRLISIDVAPVVLEAGVEQTVQPSVSKAEGLTYRFFIWDSDFIPLTAITFAAELL